MFNQLAVHQYVTPHLFTTMRFFLFRDVVVSTKHLRPFAIRSINLTTAKVFISTQISARSIKIGPCALKFLETLKITVRMNHNDAFRYDFTLCTANGRIDVLIILPHLKMILSQFREISKGGKLNGKVEADNVNRIIAYTPSQAFLPAAISTPKPRRRCSLAVTWFGC